MAEIQFYLSKMAKNDLLEVMTEVNDLKFKKFQKMHVDTIKIRTVSKNEPPKWYGG